MSSLLKGASTFFFCCDHNRAGTSTRAKKCTNEFPFRPSGRILNLVLMWMLPIRPSMYLAHFLSHHRLCHHLCDKPHPLKRISMNVMFGWSLFSHSSQKLTDRLSKALFRRPSRKLYPPISLFRIKFRTSFTEKSPLKIMSFSFFSMKLFRRKRWAKAVWTILRPSPLMEFILSGRNVPSAWTKSKLVWSPPLEISVSLSSRRILEETSVRAYFPWWMYSSLALSPFAEMSKLQLFSAVDWLSGVTIQRCGIGHVGLERQR